MTPHRLMVFGGGFIAANLALRAKFHWKWAVDVVYRKYCHPELNAVNTHPLATSSCELEALISGLDPTHVVIAIGSSFVPAINRDIQSAMDQHLNLTLMVLDTLARSKVTKLQKILTIGSASEYGSFPGHPIDETHLPQPQDPYGLMKLAQRQIGLYFYHTRRLPVIHLRQFNVSGVGQDERFVIPSICRQAAQLQFSSSPGSIASIVAGNTTVRRDFLAIQDVCEAYRTLLEHGTSGDVYNVCSGRAISIDELIAMASRSSGMRLSVDVSPELLRENDKAQAVIVGDPAKLQALGWLPKVSMPDLVESMIAHFASLRRSSPT